jgi:uncharacterized membrane protein YhiD involved in acid resistance
VRDDVEVPTGAEKKLSALLVSAPVTVERTLNRRNTGMRTAFIVAVALTFTMRAQAQARADRFPSGGSAQAAGEVSVETQAITVPRY